MTIVSERALLDKFAVLKLQETNDYSSASVQSWSCQSAVHSLKGGQHGGIEPQGERQHTLW